MPHALEKEGQAVTMAVIHAYLKTLLRPIYA